MSCAINNLAEECPDVSTWKKWVGGYIIFFILWIIIVWLILVFTKPTWVQEQTLEGVPTGKAIIWAIVIALVIGTIILVIRAATNRGKEVNYHSLYV
jgi:nitrate reductase gamma subunit